MDHDDSVLQVTGTIHSELQQRGTRREVQSAEIALSEQNVYTHGLCQDGIFPFRDVPNVYGKDNIYTTFKFIHV